MCVSNRNIPFNNNNLHCNPSITQAGHYANRVECTTIEAATDVHIACRLFDRIGAALGQDSQVVVNTVTEMFVDALLSDKRVSQFFASASHPLVRPDVTVTVHC